MRLLPLLSLIFITALGAENFIGTVFYGEIPYGTNGKQSFAVNGESHIDKVLAYLKKLNDEGSAESKHHFSSIDDIADTDLGYFDETAGVQNKDEFIGLIVKLVRIGFKAISSLFKQGAKLSTRVIAKAGSKIGVKKVPWNGTTKENTPKVNSLIGDAAEVVLKETGDNLQTTLQFADTEEGPGFLYKVEDPVSKQIIDSGFKKSDINLGDILSQIQH